MTIDLTQLHMYFLALMPVLVGVVAGLIRQDKLPPLFNECITLGLVLVLAIIQALLDGKLGASAIANFMIVAGYCQVFIKLTPINDLMKQVQTVTSIGGKAPTPAPPVLISDLQGLALNLAPFLASELVKLRLPGNAPVAPSQSQQRPVQSQANNPMVSVSTPPFSNTVPSQGYGMSSYPPQAVQTANLPQDQSLLYNLATQQVQVPSSAGQSWQPGTPMSTTSGQSG